MSRDDQDFGYLLDVMDVPLGSALAADHATGDTELSVLDGNQFDTAGGFVIIDDVPYPYTAVTFGEDIDVVTIGTAVQEPVAEGETPPPVPPPGLLAALEEGEAVSVYDNIRKGTVAERRALVVWINGDQGDDDPISCLIAQNLRDKIVTGPRMDVSEVVIVEPFESMYRVVDLVGESLRIDLSEADPDTVPPPAVGDGLPPAFSPTPTALGGLGVAYLSWDAVGDFAFDDPIQYEVYASSQPVSAVPANLVGIALGTVFSVPLEPGEWYFRLIARDTDGAAPASEQAFCTVFAPPEPFDTTALQAQLDENDQAVADAMVAVEAAQADVNTLNTVTIPQLNSDLAAADAAVAAVEGRFPITGPDLAANSVSANNITADAITAVKIQARSITALKIAVGTITAENIQAGTITTNEIAAGTITAGEVQAGSITTEKLAADAVTSAKIQAGTIEAVDIKSGTITANQIQSQTIVANLIAAGAVTATQLAAGSVSANTIAAGAITAQKLSADALDARIITGSTFRTNGFTLANLTIFDSNGIRSYDSQGRIGFSMNAGQIDMKGNIVIGQLGNNPGSFHAPAIYSDESKGSTFTVCTLSPEGRIVRTSGPVNTDGVNSSGDVVATGNKNLSGNQVYARAQGGTGFVNANLASDGRLNRNTSSRRYKEDIDPMSLDVAAGVLDLESVTYRRIAEGGKGPTYPGFIAEQVHEAGAHLWVNYDADGVIDGVRYDEITVAHNMLIRDLVDRIARLESASAA